MQCHNRKLSIILLMVSISFFLSFSPRAQTAASELEKMFSGIVSMRANFVEQMAEKGDRDLKAKLSSKAETRAQAKGEMVLSRPGKFRWEVKDPEKRLIIADGKHLWIYDEDLAQVTKKMINYENMGTPALLLSGSIKDIEKTFAVEKSNGSENSIWFKLKPKSDTDAYQWIKLHFKKKRLVAMQIADSMGQHNIIVFSAIKINKDLPPTIFQFKLPKGVDLIEE